MSRQAAALACVLTLAACSALPADSAPSAATGPSSGAVPVVPSPRLGSDYVLLDFDGPDPLVASSRSSVVGVRRAGDAPVRTTPSGDGTRGLVFPAYASTAERRLVLLVPPPSPSQVSPAPDLVFGADVQLDEGSGAGAQDNGDNVVQRGLFADQNQLKLQVDKHVPSCTVRTPRLRAFVKLTHAMDDGWYRLSCRYDGVTLDLAATPLGGSGGGPDVVSAPAAAGALSFASSTGLSVGGKVTADGALVKTQPDQFNGVLDNVFVSTSP